MVRIRSSFLVRSSLAFVIAVAITMALAAGLALAQDRRQSRPGQFDFYVLSLSWSPSFCDSAGEPAAIFSALYVRPK